MKEAKSEEKQANYIERRQYIRLNVVFPVEFQFLDPETGGSVSDIKQGFTRDVGKGGICLEVNTAEAGFEEILSSKKAKLDLRIHIPLGHRETKTVATIAWHKKIKSGYPNKYLIGLFFVEIDGKDKDRIYTYAKRISLIPRFVAILVISLAIGLTYFYASDFKMKRENKLLVQELVQLSTKKSKLEKNILDFDIEHIEVKTQLSENQERVKKYKKKIKDLKMLSVDLKKRDELLESLKQDRAETKKELEISLSERSELSKELDTLSKEARYLKDRIARLLKAKASVEDDLEDILPSFEVVEEKGISSMHKWIRNHQNRLTGLVMSYEGDKNLEDWAFTYDQSLASQVFVLTGEQENAQEIFDFYKDKAEVIDGAFVNAYDAYTGLVLEYSVHAGPNIWLGIAILQYTKKFEDEKYLPVAEKIGKWLIGLQNEDKEFGIKGGPKFDWFSTEHNLDAYSFFGMLYEITEKKEYLKAQEKALEWIKKHAYNKKEGRMNRGKGDATIATDTLAWGIAAIGPELLKKSKMDPDQIIDFAEKNCLVTTYFKRPDGEQVKVTGFDFGKYEHTARGGIISTEWTSQMIVTLKIMAEYYEKKNEFVKANYYKRKADFYLSELEKMIIISPSKVGQGEGCLPYASQDNVDTGHGWRIAIGSRTGSTAGTAYTIFAKRNYNPLTLK